MKNFIKTISRKAGKIYRQISSDPVLAADLNATSNHLPVPFSKAGKFSDVKLIIIGQDPTVREEKTRDKITTVLMLDESKNLYKYISSIAGIIDITMDEIYATNLYKCFFRIPPQDDETILTRHFRSWIELLIEEVNAFPDAAIITLGQPVIKQLIHSGNKNVNSYWDYTGQTKSSGKYSMVRADKNFLQRSFYPLPHLPTYSRNRFYKEYFYDYCKFIKKTLA